MNNEKKYIFLWDSVKFSSYKAVFSAQLDLKFVKPLTAYSFAKKNWVLNLVDVWYLTIKLNLDDESKYASVPHH